jgi:hypothetical protein
MSSNKRGGAKAVSYSSSADATAPAGSSDAKLSSKTPGTFKRLFMAGNTPYHASANMCIMNAGTPGDESDEEKDKNNEEEEDVYAEVASSRTDKTPPKKKSRVDVTSNMYVRIMTYKGKAVWVMITPLGGGCYEFFTGEKEWLGMTTPLTGKLCVMYV